MPEQPDSPPKKTPGAFRSLLGVLAFLGRYPVRSALCIVLLSVNISIEMTLPRILGDTINDLQTHAEARDSFSPAPAVTLFLTLVIVRMCVGFILEIGRAHV